MIGPDLEAKALRLNRIFKELGSMLVAFSGGVDSTLLLKCAVDTLGTDKIAAVTAISGITEPSDIEEAKKIAEDLGVRHIIIASEEMEDPEFISNTPQRCYVCKKGRYKKLADLKESLRLACIVDGSNKDDEADYRPGEKAMRELNVRSPLREAGLYKSEIRELSRELGLPTWNRPSQACLATRLPYGVPITSDRLRVIHEAEKVLHCLGFTQIRVRHHGNIARIEVPESEILEVIAHRKTIVDNLKKLGFVYVSLDLEGFRSGSLNEVISDRQASL